MIVVRCERAAASQPGVPERGTSGPASAPERGGGEWKTMRTLKLTLQYDGTSYVGWQRQAEGTSIQGLCEAALQPLAGAPVHVHGAGRTDAGVHALGQVASVSMATALDCSTLTRALNAVLPSDVRVIAVEDVREGFHARFSATGKRYEYRIVNAPIVSPFIQRYAWHVIPPLDFGGMRQASAALVGQHDFAAFRAAGSASHSSVRTIRSLEWADGGGSDCPFVMHVEGDGFLRHMVRSIVGTLVEVGLGRVPVDAVGRILASKSRAQAGPTAPARGLFLAQVQY
jgi:tRNA pseudouridine38-40 synthase